MSTEQSQTVEQQNSLHQGLGWVAKHWPRVRLGHEAFMLDKIQRQTRIVEQLAKNAMTGDDTNTDEWPGSDGDDAMGVKIGDTTINYHYPATPPQQPVQTVTPTPMPDTPATQPTPTASVAPERSKLWQTLAIAAIGGGLGAGAMALPGLFGDKNTTQPAAVVTDTDTDTQYEHGELRIRGGDTINEND